MIKIEVLKMINKNNGKMNWYKLDRSLSLKNINVAGKLMNFLQDLKENGLIKSRGVNPSMPTYFITEKGQKYLEDNKK